MPPIPHSDGMSDKVKLNGKNRELLQRYVGELKAEADALGLEWEGSFEAVIETVRKGQARECGHIRSFDETAHFVLIGCLEEHHGKAWIDRFEDTHEFE